MSSRVARRSRRRLVEAPLADTLALGVTAVRHHVVAADLFKLHSLTHWQRLGGTFRCQHRNRLHNKMAWALDLNWVQTAGFLNEEVDEDGIVQNVLQVRVRMRL